MSASYQGASGPSGPMAKSQPAHRQPVSGNHTTPEPVLNVDTLEQPSRDELLLDQIWKLNVRVLINICLTSGLTNRLVIQAPR